MPFSELTVYSLTSRCRLKTTNSTSICYIQKAGSNINYNKGFRYCMYSGEIINVRDPYIIAALANIGK